jgi:hypothetical protein
MSFVQVSSVLASSDMLKVAMPPKPWYGLLVGRRKSYHLPLDSQKEETWCLRGAPAGAAAEEVELVDVEGRGVDMMDVCSVLIE